MAVTKTVKVQVDTGNSVQQLDQVKEGFDGIDKSAQEGTAATVGMTGAVKNLRTSFKIGRYWYCDISFSGSWKCFYE